MIRSLQLLLPALIPSWRFFDYIAPSPRIQYALLDADQHIVSGWQEFRPRPAQVSMSMMLRRLFWNPIWNESLFMVSCAERLLEQHMAHSESEIMARIVGGLRKQSLPPAQQVQFRLVVIERRKNQLVQQVQFVSQPVSLA